MNGTIFVYFISILSIILGFIALLTQKIYIDPETKKPTVDVEIKFLGKLKTNVPALAFVFLGIALAVFAYSRPKQVDWTLQGQLIDEENKIVDFRTGTLKLIPGDSAEVTKLGRFDIRIKSEEGQKIEDVIEAIDYSHDDGSVSIVLKKEYEAYQKQQPSLIKSATKSFREYKPVSIQYMPKK